ncbi:MAG: hypothetical protein ACI977_000322 [Candidatus Nanohaloarchaea archaeon]|jgi:hypothetical protein
MRAIVKVVWKNTNNGWKAFLKTTDGTDFDLQGLEPGRELNYEITDERRCTGYAPEPGERAVCTEFRRIKSGSQCPECRGKDIYAGYVRGDTGTDLEGEFSVYLAQIGSKIKVGVTRSENIPKRWVEQGADYGVEICSGLSSKEALEEEQRITDQNGISQRIRKEKKINSKTSPQLENKLEELNYQGKVVDVQNLTVYPDISMPRLHRSGVLRGEIKSVKGQVIFTERIAMAMTEGKTMDRPLQTDVTSF